MRIFARCWRPSAIVRRTLHHCRRLPERRGFRCGAPHAYFPRLRLELDRAWDGKPKSRAALERLLSNAQLQQPVGAGSVSVLKAGISESPERRSDG